MAAGPAEFAKKKCDETHPKCNVCVALGLECHGYGRRPEWIDNGTLQREKSLQFKHIVSQNKMRKTSLKAFSTITDDASQHKLNGNPNLISTGHTNSLSTSPPSSSSHQSPDGWDEVAVSRDNFPWAQGDQSDVMYSVGPAAWGGPLPDSSAPTAYPALFGAGGYVATPPLSNRSSLSPGPSEWVAGLPADTPDMHVLGLWAGYDATDGTLSSNFDDTVPCRSFPADAQKTTPGDFAGLKAGTRAHAVVAPGPPAQPPTSWPMTPRSQSILGAGPEDALLMHYLDHVFYSQFPFYRSQSGRGRAWLFSILKRVEPAYHAALALSERDLASKSPPDGGSDGGTSSSDQLRTGKNHYDMALQGLQDMVDDPYTWDGHTRLVRSLECLTTILLLLFWEVFYGGKKNWQALLRTASSFISLIIQSRSIISADQNGVGEQPYKGTSHCEETRCAAIVLLDSFISFDILACASTRGTPFLDIDHTQALNSLDVPLENFSGCRNSVMALISDISLLDRWKNESQAARRLSIVDLAKRAGQIEERLRQELADITRGMQLSSAAESPTNAARMLSAQVSQLFALAAIIYLHVVVSGAHPELPEITRTVSEMLDALEKLKREPRLLRSVVWPFCVAGCVTLEEQQGFFRSLLTDPEVAKYSTKACFEALYVMEKCWAARRIDSYHCDWTSIMSKYGHYILLA